MLAAVGCGGGKDGRSVAPPTAPEAPAPAPPTEPPNKPIVRLSEEGQDFVEWAWEPVEGATGYEASLALGDSLDDRTLVRPEALVYRWEGLDPAQLAVIWVRAIRETAGGRAVSEWSDRVWAVTLPPSGLPTEPTTCTDERARAEEHSDFVREWDGTPFRVDVIANFPDRVPSASVVEHLLAPVALVDEKIEHQLGYRIIEMGDLIPVPEGMRSGWNEDAVAFRVNCPLRRERGQIHGFYMDDLNQNPLAGAQAHARCGAFSYLRPGADRLSGGTTIHEIWHLFGFVHSDDGDFLAQGRGVAMSVRLTRSGGVTALQALTWPDIDLLRCIFPEGG